MLPVAFQGTDGFFGPFYGKDLQSSRRRRSERTCFAAPVQLIDVVEQGRAGHGMAWHGMGDHYTSKLR